MDQFLSKSISFVQVQPYNRKLKKEGANLFLGSCFAENLYYYYENNYIDCLFSPFGNIYNPLSLSKSLQLLCRSRKIDEKEVFRHRELWRHFDFDTRLCNIDRDTYVNNINSALWNAGNYLKSCSCLFLTLGTSYVYRQKANGQIVNNCHTLPGSDFIRENSTISEMKDSMTEALNRVKEVNKNIRIIFTLSPVRHLRDRAEENSLSKARLRCLIDELSRDMDIQYFPAYEILLDQLRDYRWYKDDLAHPSDKAAAYIMKRFIEAAADSDFKTYLADIEKLNEMLNHRILHETAEAERFRKNRVEKFADLITRYPMMNNLKFKFDTLFSGNQ